MFLSLTTHLDQWDLAAFVGGPDWLDGDEFGISHSERVEEVDHVGERVIGGQVELDLEPGL